MSQPAHSPSTRQRSVNEFLRKVLDASLNGLYVHDVREGVNSYINRRYEQLTGYTRAQLEALDREGFAELFHPEDRPRVAAHMQRLLKADDEQQLEIEYRFHRSDGQWIWCLSLDSVMERDAGGAVRSIIGTFIDISARKQAEADLRQSEAGLRVILDNAAVGIAQVGLDGRFQRVNQRLCEITGYPRHELTRLRFQDITHPEDLPPDLDKLERLVAGEIADYSMEKRYIRKDGSLVWVNLSGSVTRRPDGRADYFIAIVDDISDRRAAEAGARTLATVVETSGDFIGVADFDGRAVYLNRAGQELVGLEGDQAVRSTRIEDYLFPEDLPFVRKTVMPTLLSEGRWAGEFRFRHFRSGDPIDVHWDVVRIDDPDTGQPVQIATVTRDIRAHKQTEASLREANRRKDEFLAVMGHELRNPMAPVCNAVEILKMLKHDDDPRIDLTLDILDRQTRHMSRLLDDLLDISRIIRDRLRLERRAVPVREVIEQAVEGVRPLMEERRHEFEVELPDAEIQVDGDPVRLAQILLNLLLNAANYTQEGGSIRIAAAADTERVAIRVRDNGPGIPPERLDDLFLPFSREKRDDGATPQGLGLGLTISRRLAELHGGRLEAESDWPRPGTEFRLVLPRLAQRAPAPQLEASPAAVERADTSILVVDDNPDVARSLTLLLQVLGYRVETAYSGEQALDLSARHSPRLALIDIGLPDMDGLELARRLRRRHAGAAPLTLVAVTGYGHDEARARSLAAGFDDHLAKPIDRRDLEDLLGRLKAEG